jgi:hypothetical protein
MSADPTPTTRADAEAMALEVLVQAMATGTPAAALQAALAVYPRTSAVPPSKDAGGKETGFGSVLVLQRRGDGTVDAEEVERGSLPGDARHTPPT